MLEKILSREVSVDSWALRVPIESFFSNGRRSPDPPARRRAVPMLAKILAKILANFLAKILVKILAKILDKILDKDLGQDLSHQKG